MRQLRFSQAVVELGFKSGLLIQSLCLQPPRHVQYDPFRFGFICLCFQRVFQQQQRMGQQEDRVRETSREMAAPIQVMGNKYMS